MALPTPRSVGERRPFIKADVAWASEMKQTCGDCLRPQRVDFFADDEQWGALVGREVCLCIECYARRADIMGVTPLFSLTPEEVPDGDEEK